MPFDPMMKKKKKKKKTGFDPDAPEGGDAPAEAPPPDAGNEEKQDEAEPVTEKPIDDGSTIMFTI